MIKPVNICKFRGRYYAEYFVYDPINFMLIKHYHNYQNRIFRITKYDYINGNLIHKSSKFGSEKLKGRFPDFVDECENLFPNMSNDKNGFIEVLLAYRIKEIKNKIRQDKINKILNK